MSGPERRVVITGIGLVTALGEGVQDTWKALLDGRTAIGPLRAYDPSPLETRIGAEITGFDPTRFVARRSLRTVTRGDQFAVAAATLAVRDAGLEDDGELGDRTGLFLGGNKDMPCFDELIAGLPAVCDEDGTVNTRRFGETAASIMAPLLFVEGLQPAAVFHVSQKFGIRGPNAFFAGTADSGATAIGRAARAIRRGEADLAVGGGYDDAVSWWAMSRMDGLGVMTNRNDLGARAFRPFDKQHSGSVFGEGAALLVLEDRDRALARDARCYAELTGFGSGNDGTRAPKPDTRAKGLSRAIAYALRDSRRTARIDYIASHGCATALGDVSETRAMHDALGADAAGAQISSVKPQTGHLAGAAGALNVAVAALALDTGFVPATVNLDEPAPGCDLDYVPGSARESRPATALAVARGLEGQAAALVLAKA